MAKVKAFRCSHSGKYLPPDYIKQWGRKYGIGLGPEPVSECLDSQYHMPVAVPEDGLGLKDYASAMHPVGVTRAQIDHVEIEEEEYEANRLILHRDDPRMQERVKILQRNQGKNPDSKIKALQAFHNPEVKNG